MTLKTELELLKKDVSDMKHIHSRLILRLLNLQMYQTVLIKYLQYTKKNLQDKKKK